MADKLVFYHNPVSRGRIVHWMLEEVGAPYETKIVDLEKREHKAPAYLAVNPMGKIPAIVDRLAARPPVERESMLSYGNYENALGALEKALAPGPWILGERFSAVDVFVGSQIGWGLFTKSLQPRPTFQKYLERCAQRPAYKRANG